VFGQSSVTCSDLSSNILSGIHKTAYGVTVARFLLSELRKLLFSLLLSVVTQFSHAAEIILEEPAVEKLLIQTLFKDAGRRYLVRSVCDTFLETPTAKILGGRIHLRFHITSKVGVPAGKTCVGRTFAGWASMSGQPVSTGGTVRLEDVRIEEVEDAAMRFLLKTGFAPAVPNALNLNIQNAVVSLLKAISPQVESTLETFEISGVTAESNTLSVKFDFKLVAK
jgi:hypothetical protein